MAHAASDHGHAAHGDAHAAGAHPHVVSMATLIGIFVILMVLTGLTFAATWVNLGYNANLMVAMAIAVIKAALVMLYFMHLRWETPFNSVVAISALLFIAIFIVVCIMDTGQYKGNYSRPGAGIEVAR